MCTGKIIRSHIIIGKDGKVEEGAYAISPEASFERAVAFVKGASEGSVHLCQQYFCLLRQSLSAIFICIVAFREKYLCV